MADSSTGSLIDDLNDLSSNVDENDHQSNEEVRIGKEETKAVSTFRAVLMSFLVAVTIAISLGAYFLSLQAEQEDFENAFESHANKVNNPKSTHY